MASHSPPELSRHVPPQPGVGIAGTTPSQPCGALRFPVALCPASWAAPTSSFTSDRTPLCSQLAAFHSRSRTELESLARTPDLSPALLCPECPPKAARDLGPPQTPVDHHHPRRYEKKMLRGLEAGDGRSVVGPEKGPEACQGHPGGAGWPACPRNRQKPLDNGTSSSKPPGRGAVLRPWVTMGVRRAVSGPAIKVRGEEETREATLTSAVRGADLCDLGQGWPLRWEGTSQDSLQAENGETETDAP
ncbi:uncharacterized protein LOC123393516 [Mustela putorius furo]|uniref:Uncharacterized protein LOC123393516 n=1 Tax=Mustela putorius furo TaxID=9669 RepID=A0A8U0SF25_MUSPF|nr:uncharacterized protein LOC123393516 [Mustela putorius furo]